MRTLRGIVGMPVVLDGQCIGRVLWAEPDEKLREIRAIWFSGHCIGARRIGRDAIDRIGSVAIIARSRGVRAKIHARPLFRRAVSTDGARLGAVVDAEIDDALQIRALWLSSGYPDDLLGGRIRIEQYSVPTGDAVLIPMGEEEKT